MFIVTLNRLILRGAHIRKGHVGFTNLGVVEFVVLYEEDTSFWSGLVLKINNIGRTFFCPTFNHNIKFIAQCLKFSAKNWWYRFRPFSSHLIIVSISLFGIVNYRVGESGISTKLSEYEPGISKKLLIISWKFFRHLETCNVLHSVW